MLHSDDEFWPSEQQLLILQASLWQGDLAINAWHEWVSQIDIDGQFDHQSFRLLPLLYHNMQKQGMTGHVMTRLKGLYRKSWYQQNLLLHQTLPYLHTMQQAGFDLLLLKGLPIGQQYYQNIALRPMSDIDILVPYSQAKAAIDFFESQGWQRHWQTWDEDIKYRHSMPFYKDKLEIDLHWYGLVDGCDEQMADIWWSRSQVHDVQGLQFKSLAPTDMLLHTIIHGMRWNKEPPIRWVADAYKIIATESVDWDLFVVQAKAWAFSQRLTLGLRFLADEMQVKIPEQVFIDLNLAPTLVELLESTYVLKDHEKIYAHPLGKLWVIFADYQSVGPRRHFIPHLWGGTLYLRNRLRVRGRLLLLQETLIGSLRRIKAKVVLKIKQVKEKYWHLFDRQAWVYFLQCYKKHYRRLFFYAVLVALQSFLILPVLFLIRDIFDVAIPNTNTRLLIELASAILLLRLLSSGLSLYIRYFIIKSIKTAIRDMRQGLIQHLYQLSKAFYSQTEVSEIQTQIVQDTERVDGMSNALFSAIIPAALSSTILFLILLNIHWQLTLIASLILPLVFISNLFTGRDIKKSVFAFQRAFEGFNKGCLFLLRQMDLTRIQSYQSQEIEHQTQILGQLKQTGESMSWSYAVHGQIQKNIMGIAGVLILVLGGMAISEGNISIGEFIAFYAAAGLLNGQINTILGGVPTIITGNESLLTLKKLYQHPLEPYSGKQLINFQGHIQIQAVTFSYEKNKILKNISLNIQPHSNNVIIGKNGSGKSTIVNLILGFWQPSSGRIAAENTDYSLLDMPALRRQIGVVLQQSNLFVGSIWDNITYGHDNVSQQEVEAVARQAMAHEFINALPNGYQSEVGESGLLLSGGERQKIAIARALLKQPKLLILDEPTNHLDIETITQFMTNLTQQPKRPALLIISHDPQVIAYADKVYQLSNGQLHAQ